MRNGLLRYALLGLFTSLLGSACFAAEAPSLVQKDGRYALLVDGRPICGSGRADQQLERVARDAA